MYWSIKSHNWAILALVFLTGCVGPEDAATFKTNLISLPAVVDSVFSNDVQDSLKSVSKTITVNQLDPETKHLDNYNIKEDLSILKDFNVATPRWVGFINSTSRDSAGYQLITYTTDNKKAPIKFVKFIKSQDNIKSIEVLSKKDNLISKQEMQVRWTLGEGFSIQKTSKLLIRKPSVFKTQVSY